MATEYLIYISFDPHFIHPWGAFGPIGLFWNLAADVPGDGRDIISTINPNYEELPLQAIQTYTFFLSWTTSTTLLRVALYTT